MVDVIIPVFNEGSHFLAILEILGREVKTPFRVLVCYDYDADPTIQALQNFKPSFPLLLVKNEGKGVAGAVLTGFRKSSSEAVVVYPADDDKNASILDEMIARFRAGADIVAPSRFMKGGCMVGCRWLKATLVRTAAFTLYHLARVPTHDATNGFRLFSRRVITQISIESSDGFAFSIELLVKCHRRGWKICEIPSSWFERKQGRSRFKIFKWLPVYLKWYFYAFATAFMGRAKPNADGD